MGLDLVEFAIAVEERFHLSIPDQDAQVLLTPRRLIDYLAERLKTSPPQGTCLTQHAFYCFRRVFMKDLGVPRDQVLRQSRLDTLVPRKNRRLVWAGLQKEIALPDLKRPSFVVWTLFFMGLVLSLSSLVYLVIQGMNFWPACVLVLVLVGIMAWLMAWLSEPWRTEFGKDYQSVEEVVRYLVPFTATSLPENERTWKRDEIKEVIFGLMCVNLGLRREDFNEDSEFVKDLGIS